MSSVADHYIKLLEEENLCLKEEIGGLQAELERLRGDVIGHFQDKVEQLRADNERLKAKLIEGAVDDQLEIDRLRDELAVWQERALNLSGEKLAESISKYDSHSMTREKKILDMLTYHFKGDTKKANTWYVTENPLLGGISPKDMVLSGRYDRLYKFISEKITPARKK